MESGYDPFLGLQSLTGFSVILRQETENEDSSVFVIRTLFPSLVTMSIYTILTINLYFENTIHVSSLSPCLNLGHRDSLCQAYT